mmetsp:Transcript_155625/g.270770  ORF Transcript_155625/g.270770 Transcript_155625/m.270770 type:complete len:210 (-) Transcript_155625:396-1025(-)
MMTSSTETLWRCEQYWQMTANFLHVTFDELKALAKFVALPILQCQALVQAIDEEALLMPKHFHTLTVCLKHLFDFFRRHARLVLLLSAVLTPSCVLSLDKFSSGALDSSKLLHDFSPDFVANLDTKLANMLGNVRHHCLSLHSEVCSDFVDQDLCPVALLICMNVMHAPHFDHGSVQLGQCGGCNFLTSSSSSLLLPLQLLTNGIGFST